MSKSLAAQLLAFAVLPAIALQAAGDGAAPSQTQCFVSLKTMAPRSVFVGRVGYSLSSVLAFEENGTLKKVLQPGTPFLSEVRRSDGSSLRKGDVVAQLDTYAAENKVGINTTKLKTAENNLRKCEDDFKRDKGLYEKQALSQVNFKHSESSYVAAQLAYAEAQLALELSQRALDVCTLRAPFDGEVEEIYMSEGSAVDHGKPIVKLVSLSPMKVTVKLPSALTRKIDRTVKVLVQPSDLSMPPQAAWLAKNSVKSESVECFVANPNCDLGASPETKGLPAVRGLCFVSQLAGTESIAPFWISPDALVKSGDSFFVWRVKGMALGEPAAVPRVITTERLAITLGDQEMVQGMFRLRGVEAGPLKRHDVLVANPADDLKDGGQAAYLEQRRLFRNGEEVFVAFEPDLGRPGFYVPRDAVVDGRILALEDGKLKAHTVKPVDIYNDMVCIEGPSLKEGMLVAVPDAYPVLYEGRGFKDGEIRVKSIGLDGGKAKTAP